MDENIKDEIVFQQPKADRERKVIASRCSAKLKLSMPVLVDTMNNQVDEQYAAWPERLFVVGKDGRIAYAGKQGPWGFKPEEVAAWLSAHVGDPAPLPEQ